MTRKVMAGTLASCLVLATCMGRPPVEVAVERPADQTFTCEQLIEEIKAARLMRVNLTKEAIEQRQRNDIFLAIASAHIYLLPAMLLPDFQYAALKEALEYDLRIEHLYMTYGERCGGDPIELMKRADKPDPVITHETLTATPPATTTATPSATPPVAVASSAPASPKVSPTAEPLVDVCAKQRIGETWEDFAVRGCSRTGPTAFVPAHPRNDLTGGSTWTNCETQKVGETQEDFDKRCG